MQLKEYKEKAIVPIPAALGKYLLLTLDFETFYSSSYSLSKMSTPEYVGHPEYKTQMVGIKINNNEVDVIAPEHIQATLDYITKLAKDTNRKIILIAHNILFDGYILG